MGAMRPYIVRQGDYLAKIAFEQGFDADEVWKHEKNKDLRESGRTPEVLCPGDQLFIAAQRSRSVAVALRSSNQFSAQVPIERVVVCFGDTETRVANEPFTAVGNGYRALGTTDGDGTATLNVPSTVREVALAFDKIELRVVLLVGHLDPGVEESGQEQRLANLGFGGASSDTHAVEAALSVGPNEPAISAFQVFAGLPVSGKMDEATAKALVREYGF